MAKRGRKTKQSNHEVSKKQKIINESNGLLCLFGNRIVSKYSDHYLKCLKATHGEEFYLDYLDLDQCNLDEASRYTQEYLRKNQKRNQAVVRYRQKQKKQVEDEIIAIVKLRQNNKLLRKKLEDITSIKRKCIKFLRQLKSEKCSVAEADIKHLIDNI